MKSLDYYWKSIRFFVNARKQLQNYIHSQSYYLMESYIFATLESEIL